MELTINKKTYNFVFGFAFLEAMDKEFSPELNGFKTEVSGLTIANTGILSGNPVTITKTLKIANATEKPRVGTEELFEYVTEHEEVVEQLIDALKKTKSTQNIMKSTTDKIEKE